MTAHPRDGAYEHHFDNVDMPHLRCGPDQDVVQTAGTVSNVVAVWHDGVMTSGAGGDGRVLGVVYIRGSASLGSAG